MADPQPVDPPSDERSAKRTATLSRVLSVYCGTYTHPGYGELTIWQREDSLQFRYYNTSSSLRYREGDTFENAVISRRIDQSWGHNRFVFQPDAVGNMVPVTIDPMPEADMPIRFSRQKARR